MASLSSLVWADWAAWHLPGGPVGPASRWAATSNVEVGQMTFTVNRGRIGREEREGVRDKVRGAEGRREWNGSEGGP